MDDFVVVGFALEVEAEHEFEVVDIEGADGEVVRCDLEDLAVVAVGFFEGLGVDVAGAYAALA